MVRIIKDSEYLTLYNTFILQASQRDSTPTVFVNSDVYLYAPEILDIKVIYSKYYIFHQVLKIDQKDSSKVYYNQDNGKTFDPER